MFIYYYSAKAESCDHCCLLVCQAFVLSNHDKPNVVDIGKGWPSRRG